MKPKDQELLWRSHYGKNWTDKGMIITAESRVPGFRKIGVQDLPVKSICEFGCNRGYNLVALSKIGDYDLTGVDLQDYALKQCSNDKINMVYSNCSKTPFADNSFDMVMTVCLLCTTDSDTLRNIIKEILRVSKRYALILEYPLAIDEEDYPKEVWKEIELLFRLREVNMFWYRQYDHRFPGCKLLSEGKVDREVGFDTAYYWWLFEKEQHG